MLIRLSPANNVPPRAFENVISHTATSFDCHAVIVYVKTDVREIRFYLAADAVSKTPATFEQHKQVIATLLLIDSGAEIVTPKHTYSGWADFSAKTFDSLPGELNDISTT